MAGSAGGNVGLTPAEKYQLWLEVVTGQGTQRETADKWGIDRSTVTHIVKLAKEGAMGRLASSRPGRPGKTAAEVALEDTLAENARLRETITEQAIELHLFRGKDGWECPPARSRPGWTLQSRPVCST